LEDTIEKGIFIAPKIYYLKIKKYNENNEVYY
jgi:hypothetical protein